MYQLFCYMCDMDNLGGKVSVSPEEALAKASPKNAKRIIYYSNAGARETP